MANGDYVQEIGGRIREETVITDGSGLSVIPFPSYTEPTLKSTDDLPEGKKNLYLTKERLVSVMGDVSFKANEEAITAAVNKALAAKGSGNAPADVSETLDTIKRDLATRAGKDELSLGLAKKVSVEDLNERLKTVARRADTDTLTSDLNALASTVADKANKAQVVTLETLVAGKADSLALTKVDSREAAHYKELSSALEGKATKDELLQATQGAANFTVALAGKAGADDLKALKLQVGENAKLVQTGLTELESRLKETIDTGNAEQNKAIDNVSRRLSALVIPAWSEINKKLDERVSAVKYAEDRAAEVEANATLRNAITAETQARTEANRELKGYVRETVNEAKSSILDSLYTKLSDRATVSQVQSEIRTALQNQSSELKALLNEKDSENDALAQNLQASLVSIRNNVDSRISMINDRLVDIPNRAYVNTAIQQALSGISYNGAGANSGGVSRFDLSTLETTLRGEINTAKASLVTKTELDSRLALLGNASGNVDVSRLTNYATITYVNEEINKAKAAVTTGLATTAALALVSDRVTALEGAKPNLTNYATQTDLTNTTTTLRQEIKAVSDRLVEASTLQAGLMSAADKTKLNGAMTRVEVIELLKAVLSVPLTAEDDTVLGSLADVSKIK
jgi:hypothetical protein